MEETTHAVAEASATNKQSMTFNLAVLVALVAGLIVFAVAAPVTYNVYKLIHVVAAVVWAGGATVLMILALLYERTNNPLELAGYAKKAELVGMRLFMPASLVALVFGLLLMHEGGLPYDQFWVIAALIGWAMTFVTGIAFIRPVTNKLAALLTERDVTDPEVQGLMKRIMLITRVDVAVLLLVVADMTAKPFS
jgi:uncharacterized membrane protein